MIELPAKPDGRLASDLRAWHSAWLLSVEKRVRLLRLRAALEEDDGFLHPHATIETHFPSETLDQTTFWAPSAVGEVFLDNGVYGRALDLLDHEGVHAFALQETARLLIDRCAKSRGFRPNGMFGRQVIELGRARRGCWLGRHTHLLCAAIEESGWIEPELGMCVRCSVVRPIDALHAFCSPTFPLPVYACRSTQPPPIVSVSMSTTTGAARAAARRVDGACERWGHQSRSPDQKVR